MINTDFLIPVPASDLRIGDKVYLGEERFGKLFTCISVSPVIVSDRVSHTEWTLKPEEQAYMPDPVIQFVYEYINHYETDPDYIELSRLMAVLNASDLNEQITDPEVINNMRVKMRYLYGRLFIKARASAFK